MFLHHNYKTKTRNWGRVGELEASFEADCEEGSL